MTPGLEYSNAIWWVMHHSDDPSLGAFPIVCYVDDSGTQEKGILAVVGGPIILKRSYGFFNLGWDHVLTRHNIAGPIHMKEFARPDGRLAYLTDGDRLALFSDLVPVINEHKVYSISASITEQEFREFFPHERFKGLFGAASLAFSYCISRNYAMWDLNKLSQNPGPLAYLVSDSQESSQLLEMHRMFKRFDKDRKTDCIGSITFDSHKRVYALQAADMIAWSNRKKKLGESFSSGFQPLEGLTRTVRGQERNYPHFHAEVSRRRTETLAQMVNGGFPVLPKIGRVPLVLEKKDVKQIQAAFRQMESGSMGRMKTEPSTPSEFQRFDAALGKILSVSHDELKRREKEWKKRRKTKKRAKA